MDAESPATELSKLGAEALRDLYNNLAGVKAFALEQAPDVCQQMVYWQIARSAMAITALLIVGIALHFVIRAAVKYEWDRDVAGPMIGIFGGCAVVVAAGVAACESVAAIQAIVAPKLFLLEKIASLIKG